MDSSKLPKSRPQCALSMNISRNAIRRAEARTVSYVINNSSREPEMAEVTEQHLRQKLRPFPARDEKRFRNIFRREKKLADLKPWRNVLAKVDAPGCVNSAGKLGQK